MPSWSNISDILLKKTLFGTCAGTWYYTALVLCIKAKFQSFAQFVLKINNTLSIQITYFCILTVAKIVYADGRIKQKYKGIEVYSLWQRRTRACN
jgi:hypothetical protein